MFSTSLANNLQPRKVRIILIPYETKEELSLVAALSTHAMRFFILPRLATKNKKDH